MDGERKWRRGERQKGEVVEWVWLSAYHYDRLSLYGEFVCAWVLFNQCVLSSDVQSSSCLTTFLSKISSWGIPNKVTSPRAFHARLSRDSTWHRGSTVLLCIRVTHLTCLCRTLKILSPLSICQLQSTPSPELVLADPNAQLHQLVTTYRALTSPNRTPKTATSLSCSITQKGPRLFSTSVPIDFHDMSAVIISFLQ